MDIADICTNGFQNFHKDFLDKNYRKKDLNGRKKFSINARSQTWDTLTFSYRQIDGNMSPLTPPKLIENENNQTRLEKLRQWKEKKNKQKEKGKKKAKPIFKVFRVDHGIGLHDFEAVNKEINYSVNKPIAGTNQTSQMFADKKAPKHPKENRFNNTKKILSRTKSNVPIKRLPNAIAKNSKKALSSATLSKKDRVSPKANKSVGREIKQTYEETFTDESVEQDRHILRRKLHSKESELDARIIELQNDVSELTSKLNAKDNLLKQWERDKSGLMAELGAQNTRLTTQLKEASQKEQQLRRELDEYKERLTLGKSSLQEHMSSVSGLRDELELVTEKNRELERRLHLAAADRDNIGLALEEASDRILMLERHAREQDMRYQQSIKEYSLPQEKLSIEERLSAGEERSLLSEMDISEPTLSQECMSVYRQLRSLVQQLKSHSDDDSGLHSDCSTTSLDDSTRFAPGMLTEVAQELVGLVLDTDVVRLLERLEQARREIQDRDEELARRADRIMELNTKASVCEVELESALEQRDRAIHDASDTSLAQDDVVIKAREDRDTAVQRRIKVEVELAKTRVELMQANSQLLETVQQKVELSQQLEQWQIDMHELLDEQLKNKLSNQEIKLKIPSEPIVPPRRRYLLKFFHR